MAPIKVGIVGYGFSTSCFHLPYILPNHDLEVYAFLQRAAPPTGPDDTPRWSYCTIDFPQAKHYRTADEFYADDLIELVVVLTADHEEFVEKGLLAGKHGGLLSQLVVMKTGRANQWGWVVVVVEKPFVKTSAEADRLIALAKEKGVILTVFHSELSS